MIDWPDQTTVPGYSWGWSSSTMGSLQDLKRRHALNGMACRFMSHCWGLKINMTRWNHPYSSLTWGWLNRQQNMDSQRDAILGTARRNMPPPRLTANPGVQIIRFAASFWHVVSESKETFVWKYGTQKKTSGWKLSCFSCHFENAPHFQTHSKGTHFTP